METTEALVDFSAKLEWDTCKSRKSYILFFKVLHLKNDVNYYIFIAFLRIFRIPQLSISSSSPPPPSTSASTSLLTLSNTDPNGLCRVKAEPMSPRTTEMHQQQSQQQHQHMLARPSSTNSIPGGGTNGSSQQMQQQQPLLSPGHLSSGTY